MRLPWRLHLREHHGTTTIHRLPGGFELILPCAGLAGCRVPSSTLSRPSLGTSDYLTRLTGLEPALLDQRLTLLSSRLEDDPRSSSLPHHHHPCKRVWPRCQCASGHIPGPPVFHWPWSLASDTVEVLGYSLGTHGLAQSPASEC